MEKFRRGVDGFGPAGGMQERGGEHALRHVGRTLGRHAADADKQHVFLPPGRVGGLIGGVRRRIVIGKHGVDLFDAAERLGHQLAGVDLGRIDVAFGDEPIAGVPQLGPKCRVRVPRPAANPPAL